MTGSSQLPSNKNNPSANVACFGVACSDLLHPDRSLSAMQSYCLWWVPAAVFPGGRATILGLDSKKGHFIRHLVALNGNTQP